MEVPKLGEKSLHLQRAITLKIVGIELWFLYTALFYNVIYLCVKFKVNSFYTLEIMPRTKIHGKTFQSTITRNRNGIEL